MQVRIGVQFVAKELVIETRMSSEQVERELRSALTEDQGVLVLQDERGSKIAVPAAHVAYVELAADESRQVGFGAI